MGKISKSRQPSYCTWATTPFFLFFCFPLTTQRALQFYLTGDQMGENGEQRKCSFQLSHLSCGGMFATCHSIQTAQHLTWTSQSTWRYKQTVVQLKSLSDYTNTHTYIPTWPTHTHMCTHICIHIYICMNRCVHAYMHMCTYSCTHARTYAHPCKHICMHAHTPYRHRHKHV